MRVCFLTPALPAREPVAEHARRLAATLTRTPPDEEFDVAVATDWTTTARLFEVRATRYVFWVDHFAHRRMGTWQAERFAAQLAYDLPVDFIAAAPWIRETLSDVRPDARCELVTSGAPEVPVRGAPARGAAGSAAPGAGRSGPLRVHLAGDGDERAAFDAMAEPAESVSLAEADVVLMLSAVDGVLGAPLAGFAAGATAVVGPAHDAQDLVRHDENGFVADADDPRGAARLLDRLARDRDLLARLRDNARATAAGWPTWERSAEEMRRALERILAEEPPPQARWPVRLMGDAVGGAAVFKQEHATLSGEIHRLRAPRRPLHRRVLGPVKRRALRFLKG